MDKDEPCDGPCMACGEIQRQVICNACRPVFGFMEHWPFEKIVHYFMTGEVMA